MKTVGKIAKSRIMYHKSRTILTIIAITLTTMMLMALATSVVGMIDMQKKQVTQSGSNQHAVFRDITKEQAQILQHHADIEALQTSELFATVIYDKMNGMLNHTQERVGKITSAYGNLIEGHQAEAENEITGPAAFFERLGANARLGETVTISFRPGGDGEIVTKEFTIVGLMSQRDISKMDVSDSRIAYGAQISKALLDRYIPDEEHRFTAAIRVRNEAQMNYDQITEQIKEIASDIGVKENDINFNKEYLFVMTDPGWEVISGAAVIALLIMLFAGLVIYSIYYVSVITDVQELGKLKALGASKKQIRRILFLEGMMTCLIAIPIGLLFGYLIPYIAFPLIIKVTMDQAMAVSLFSPMMALIVTAAVLLTVIVSLFKPMRMASKISPIEAIRYQEEGAGKQAKRKGYKEVTISRLSWANLSRNRKRTAVTIITMGLSCVLFMGLAGVLNSMDPRDIAQRNIPKGDFALGLKESYNDKVYPENNIDSLQKQDLLGNEMVSKIKAIPGVTEVESGVVIAAEAQTHNGAFEDGRRVGVTTFTREDIPQMRKELQRGELDYDKMVKENAVVFQYDTLFEEYGLSIGDRISFVLYDGDRKVSFEAVLSASGTTGDYLFAMPQDLADALIHEINPTGRLYITAEKSAYSEVKEALKEIEESNQYFRMYSFDEEMKIGELAVKTVKYPVYAILVMIGIIGFMNLMNTMITSIVTRKRELGILQAVGLSNRQLTRMLQRESMVFTAGTLACAVVVGNLLGYLVFLYAKNTHFMDVHIYHYPLWETVFLALAMVLGQLFITWMTSRWVHKESLIDRIRTQE